MRLAISGKKIKSIAKNCAEHKDESVKTKEETRKLFEYD